MILASDAQAGKVSSEHFEDIQRGRTEASRSLRSSGPYLRTTSSYAARAILQRRLESSISFRRIDVHDCSPFARKPVSFCRIARRKGPVGEATVQVSTRPA